MSKRVKQWRQRLDAAIDMARLQPFKPGKNDCALFAAECIKAVTGVDLARGLRGYRSIEQGMARLSAKGFDNHIELVASHFDEIHISQAQTGDLAVVETGDACEPEQALGVVDGPRIFVVGLSGLGTVGLLTGSRAFSVQ